MAVSINNLTRRRFFGFTAIVMASTAIPALMWHTWNKERIIAALIARSDEYHEDSWTDRYSAAEVESYKMAGGWPEYGIGGSRMMEQEVRPFPELPSFNRLHNGVS